MTEKKTGILLIDTDGLADFDTVFEEEFSPDGKDGRIVMDCTCVSSSSTGGSYGVKPDIDLVEDLPV